MKKTFIKHFVLFLIIFITISNDVFAAIVSDNDGSAFVTKAEFDALKNSFNKQINDYNTSIDGKIDGAIAQYLSGMKLSSTETMDGNITFIHYPCKVYDYSIPLKNVYKPADAADGTIARGQDSAWTMEIRARSMFLRGPWADVTSTLIPSIDKIGNWFLGEPIGSPYNQFKINGIAMNIKLAANVFFMGDNLMATDHEAGILTFDQKVMNNNWGGGSQTSKTRPNTSVYADYEICRESNKIYTTVPDTVFTTSGTNFKNNITVGDKTNGYDCIKSSGGYIMWGSPDHTVASFTDMNTMTHSESSVPYIDMIYNNATDLKATNNAPVAYSGADDDGIVTPFIYYTNKKWNRIYNNTASNFRQAAFSNRTKQASANYGIFGAITLGENVETEYEDVGRDWYKKSAIKQSRLVYDFVADGRTFSNHKMTCGIPILVVPSSINEISSCTLTLNLDLGSGTSDKYIVLSKNPIDIQGTTMVPTSSDIYIIDKLNGTIVNDNKAKVINGINKIEFKGLQKGEVLYAKVLWLASDSDNMIEIKDNPSFIFQLAQ